MASIESLLSGRRLLVMDASRSTLDAAREMTEHKVGATLIVDDEGRPAGIFTERDLMTRIVVAGLDPARTKLSDAMTVGVLVARANEPIAIVALEMQRHHVRHIPVVDAQGRAIAMLSLRDLLRRDLVEREEELNAIHDYISSSDAGDTGFRRAPSF